MAMFFEKRNRKGKKQGPMDSDRYETMQDIKALARAKKVEKDAGRHHRAQNLAKEKLASRKRKGPGGEGDGKESRDNTIG